LRDLRTTGKFAQRYSVANSLRTFLANNHPELVSPIYIDATGADASDAAAASLDALSNLFVESSVYLVTDAPASLALYRRRLTGVRQARLWRFNRGLACVAAVCGTRQSCSGTQVAYKILPP
jgi:hypothetical protein